MKVPRLFKKLDSRTKIALLKLIGVNPASEADTDLTEQLETETEDRGVRTLLEDLDKEHLVELYKATPGAEPEPEEDEGDAGGKKKKQALTSKAAMLKRLQDRVAEVKVERWLRDLEERQVEFIAEALEIEERPKGKAALEAAVVDRVYAEGGLSIFTGAPKDLLARVCVQGGLKATAQHSKAQLLEALETGDLPKAEKRERPGAAEPSEEKPERIEKGITAADLHSHYYFGELQAYCKKEGVRSGGNKKEVIKRILAHLDGDETVNKDYKKPAKPSKKRAAAAKAAKEPAAKKARKADKDEAPAAADKDEDKDEAPAAAAKDEPAEPAKKKAKKGEDKDDKEEAPKKKDDKKDKDDKEEAPKKKDEPKKDEKKAAAAEEKKDDKKAAAAAKKDEKKDDEKKDKDDDKKKEDKEEPKKAKDDDKKKKDDKKGR